MSKKSSSSNSTSNTYNTQNIALDGVEGIALVGDGSAVTVYSTDYGAVREALELSESVSGGAMQLGAHAVDGALGFGAGALDGALEFGRAALDYSAESYDEFLQAMDEQDKRAMGLVSDVTGQAIAGAFAAARSESQATLETVGKWIMTGLAAAAVVAVVRA